MAAGRCRYTHAPLRQRVAGRAPAYDEYAERSRLWRVCGRRGVRGECMRRCGVRGESEEHLRAQPCAHTKNRTNRQDKTRQDKTRQDRRTNKPAVKARRPGLGSELLS
jgi:hypothetical protein